LGGAPIERALTRGQRGEAREAGAEHAAAPASSA